MDVIWGAVIGLLAWNAFRLNPVNLGLLALAAMLVGVGLWLIIRPTPIGTIIDGVTLLIVSAWNVFIYMLELRRPGMIVNPLSPALFIVQGFWGIYRLRQYPRFAAAAALSPSAVTVKWLAGLSNATLKAAARHDPQIIAFATNNGITYRKWKGRLLPEVAIFVNSTGGLASRRDVLLASRDGIEITQEKKKIMQKKYKVSLRIMQKQLKATIPQESLVRLKAWMASPDSTTPVAAIPK